MNSPTPDRTPTASQKVYQLLQEGGATVGKIITHEELKEVGCDVGQSRSPVYQASKWLLLNEGLNLVAVRGVGYQITHPDKAPALIGERLTRAGRQVGKAGQIGTRTTREGMSKDSRTQTDALLACTLGLQQEFRDMKRRVEFQSKLLAQHNEDIEQLKQRSGIPFTEEQVAALKGMIQEQESQRLERS